MRKPPTEEQRAAAEARRARLRDLCKQIAAMSDAQRADFAGRISPVTVEGHALSLHNCMMIAFQCPTATVVGGFQQWKRAGRCVRKGEHGIGIWVPKFGKDEGGEESGSPETFLFGTVFDVSQTEPARAEVEA